MNLRVKLIYDEAQKLDAAEREELAELLIASIENDPDIDEAWLQEARQRWDEHKATGDEPPDALKAVEEARRELRGAS